MMTNLTILILMVAALTTLLTLQTLYPHAAKLGLTDQPSQRKQHQGAIPLIGGIGMFSGILISAILAMDMDRITLTWLTGLSAIVILGVIDDARDISVKLRLLIQALVALALCLGSGYYLQNLGNLLNFGDIQLHWFGYPITIIAVIGGMNAYNMMDGIDGLAGSMAFLTLSGLALLFHLGGSNYGLTLAGLLLVVLLPYLAKNLRFPPFKNKIFMGDAGSMLLGFCIVWLLVYGSQHKLESLKPVTALWLIALPLMDMVMVMTSRIAAKQSPFAAGRDHMHHVLIDSGFSHLKTLLFMIAVAIALIVLGIMLDQLNSPEYLSFLLFLLVFVFFFWQKKRLAKYKDG